jgi:hypothetical protein
MAVQIRWQSSDLSTLHPAPTTPARESFNTDTNAYFDFWVSTDTYSYTYSGSSALPTERLTKDLGAYSTVTRFLTPTPTPTASIKTLPAQAGMSKSTKIGIGVAVPIAFLGFAAAAIAGFLLLRRRRSKTSKSSQASSSDDYPEVATRHRSHPSAQYATMEKSIQMTASPTPLEEFPTPPNTTSFNQVPRNSTSNDSRQFSASPSPPPHGPDSIGIATTLGPASPTGSSGHVRVSSLPEVVVNPREDNEVKRIKEEQARLRERKSRLFQMAQLDQEEEQLRRRLESRLTQIGGPRQSA